MGLKKGVDVKPASGKLGILLPGMGAVATTFIAGVQAIRKGIESAKKNLLRVNLNQTTIPHQVLGRYGSGMVLLKPAPEGTGVIAGGAVRAVMTSAGVQNVLTKSIGTTNPHNVIKATFNALGKLRDRQEVAAGRGKAVEEL